MFLEKLIIGILLVAFLVPTVSYGSDLIEKNSGVLINSGTSDSAIKSKIIDKGIDKGMYYLYEHQLSNGQFPVYTSYSPDMSDGKNELVIGDTAFILHTLNLADNKYTKKIVQEMKTKAITFLLDNREKHGVWRFMGKNNPLPPDTDDTSMVFASLIESHVNISDETLDYMLNFRTSNGIFYTWINSEEWLDPSNPYYENLKNNDIDQDVNADVLYAYSLRNRTQKEVIRYLNNISKNKLFLNSTIYYPSPYVFAYYVTKVYSDGKVRELNPSLNNIKDYILTTQKSDGGWGNDLDTAFATVSLLNIDYKGKPLEKAIEYILDNQNKNGSWDIYAFYTQPSNPTLYYGSQELTTSATIETLIKYNNRRNRHV